jgi:hypothetical protein
VHLSTPAAAVRRVYPANLDYHLKEGARSVTLEILDAGGNPVRTILQKDLSVRGAHRVTWDLHYVGASVFPGMVLRSANPQQGPWAVPGRYQVKLTVDGASQIRAFSVLPDPRLKDVALSDLEAQFKLSMAIRDAVSAANQAVTRIRDLKKQITARSAAAPDAQVQNEAAALIAKLSAVEQELYQVNNQSSKDVLALPIKLNNRLASLLRVAQSADARPTAQTYTVFDLLNADLKKQLATLTQLLSRDVAQFNEVLVNRNLAAVK